MIEIHFSLLVVNAFLVAPFRAQSVGVCDESAPDIRSCDMQCNTSWGRVPWLNVPWARGACRDSKCVCRFNYEDLQPYEAQLCIQKSVWSSFKSKRRYVREAIEAKVIRMSAEEQFEAFKKAYKKKYASTTEELRRFDIFKQNLIVIDKLMATKRGNVVFGVGPFTDYTSQEWQDEMGILKLNPAPDENQQLQPRMLNAFSKMTLSRKGSSRSSSRGDRSNRGSRSPSPAPSERSSRASERSTRSSRGQSVPPSWSPGPFVRRIVGRDPQGGPTLDWRIPAAFYPPTESQNQHGRKCGACWAFAVLGAVEILLPRVQGYITSLSKQALIDCVVTNDGCHGGDMRDAIVYLIKIGVPSAVSYPYMARNGRCKSFIGPYMKLNYYTDVPGANQLAEHLEHSPLPSILYAPLELQHYVSGVYDSPGCTNEVSKINHAGVIVGQYTDAWIVRFSVESDWGLQGHILIAKGRCGLGLQSFEINSPFTILRRS